MKRWVVRPPKSWRRSHSTRLTRHQLFCRRRQHGERSKRVLIIALGGDPSSKSSRKALGPQPGDRRREAGGVVHAGRPAEEFLRLEGTEVLVRPEHVHRLPREQGRGLEARDLSQQPVTGLEGEPDGVRHAVGGTEPDRGIPEALGQERPPKWASSCSTGLGPSKPSTSWSRRCAAEAS